MMSGCAGFFLKPPDPADLARSLVESSWLRIMELMHEMQEKYRTLQSQQPPDSHLAEEALHQVRR
jgi:hypothetical protein